MRPLTFTFGLTAIVLLAAAPYLRADKIVLVAGGGDGSNDVEATKAKLESPLGIAFDEAGSLYFVEMTSHRVCRIDGKGMLHVIAGTGAKGDKGDDGPAVKASFNGPHSPAVAPNGNRFPILRRDVYG
jgi:hypothetical protein